MIEGVEPDPRGAVDSHVEAPAKPCAKRPWCVREVGHDGPCHEAPHAAIARNDFGPRRSKP